MWWSYAQAAYVRLWRCQTQRKVERDQFIGYKQVQFQLNGVIGENQTGWRGGGRLEGSHQPHEHNARRTIT